MIKHVTNAYVFKFVGGEADMTRTCHYCRQEKKGGMIAVYGNTDSDAEDTIFVCPSCAVQGCRESEEQWQAIDNRANLLDVLKKDIHDSTGK